MESKQPVTDGEKTVQALLIAARDAREAAYAPYSNYKVGAAVLTDTNKVYTGCNVENASYGLTICAERVAIQKAVSEGARKITLLAVITEGPEIARPCGACLQVMAEFADDSLIIAAGNINLEYDLFTLNDYLPKRFKM